MHEIKIGSHVFPKINPEFSIKRSKLPERPQLRETVTVIGSGIAGCTTAWMLSEAGYGVTVLEKFDEPFNSTSRGAVGIHLGGRYPKSWETATECLESGILMKKLMPFAFGAQKLRFLVANTSDTPFEDYVAFYSQLRDYYVSLPESKHVFGPPEDFFKILNPEELSQFINIDGGIATQESLFNMERVRKILLHTLTERGVKIITATEAISIKKDDNGHTVSLRNNKTGETSLLHSEVVINTAGHGARALTQQLGEKPLMKHDLMTFFEFQIDEQTSNTYPFPFVVIPGHMHYAPLETNACIASIVGFSGALEKNIVQENEDITIPSHWDEMLRTRRIPYSDLPHRVIEQVRTNFMPRLGETKLHNMYPGVAISFAPEQYVKTQHALEENENLPGYIFAVPTKATHAATLALDIVRLIVKNSLKKDPTLQLSFYTQGIINGDSIAFIDDDHVSGDESSTQGNNTLSLSN